MIRYKANISCGTVSSMTGVEPLKVIMANTLGLKVSEVLR